MLAFSPGGLLALQFARVSKGNRARHGNKRHAGPGLTFIGDSK
jgi:hypothetical protein